MVEIIKNPVNIDNIITNKTFISKITPYLFNIKIIISIIIIAILGYIKFKYYNKNTANTIKKETSAELYDYVIMDKNNKVWKVTQDFFERLNNGNNYNNLPTTLLNNIKNDNFKQDNEEFQQKNDANTSDIISDTIANNK